MAATMPRRQVSALLRVIVAAAAAASLIGTVGSLGFLSTPPQPRQSVTQDLTTSIIAAGAAGAVVAPEAALATGRNLEEQIQNGEVPFAGVVMFVGLLPNLLVFGILATIISDFIGKGGGWYSSTPGGD